MRRFLIMLPALCLLLAGCGAGMSGTYHPLGLKSAGDLTFARDGTYQLRLWSGAQANGDPIYQTSGGTYRLEGNKLTLVPKEMAENQQQLAQMSKNPLGEAFVNALKASGVAELPEDRKAFTVWGVSFERAEE